MIRWEPISLIIYIYVNEWIDYFKAKNHWIYNFRKERLLKSGAFSLLNVFQIGSFRKKWGEVLDNTSKGVNLSSFMLSWNSKVILLSAYLSFLDLKAY